MPLAAVDRSPASWLSLRESWSAQRRGQRWQRGEQGSLWAAHNRPMLPLPLVSGSCGDGDVCVGMGMSFFGSGRFCHWDGPWARRLGAGGYQSASSPSLTLFSAVCTPGVPLFNPSRVRQLEEELRTMDQSLKSLIASEEEVLGQGRGATCSSPPSLCRCLSNCASHLSPLCTAASATNLPSPSAPAGAGWACSSIPPCLRSSSVGLARAQLAVMHRASM